MIGDRELAELVSLAKRDNAKLVVVGDPRAAPTHRRRRTDAHPGEHIGRVLVTENVRQRSPGSEPPSKLVRDGEARAAYDLYLSHGRIHVAESAPERRAEVVSEHARLEDRGVNAVILAQHATRCRPQRARPGQGGPGRACARTCADRGRQGIPDW